MASATAAPGTLVRWPGEGIESCERAGSSWRPVGGACWFAVDLLQTEGELTVFRRRQGRREAARIRITAYTYPVQHITLQDDSQVHLSRESLLRVGREQSRVGALWGIDRPRRFTPPLGPPLASLPEGGRFGSRRFFNGEPRSPHSGADYASPEGTPVLATADGEVALADDLFFSGNSVFVDHGDRLVSMYFHLSEMFVKEGDQVTRGQAIGRVGATGRATGPHLHFGLRWRGARVDPRWLLRPPESVTELR